MKRPLLLCLFAGSLLLADVLRAQVHYEPGGRPWTETARSGPDAEVPGWYYNLGVTGIRVELVEAAPKTLLVRHVFEVSPAHGRVRPGDVLIGVAGRAFQQPHENGYGEDVFGATGPLSEVALALEACQSPTGKGKLKLSLQRDGQVKQVSIPVGRRYGSFAPHYPADCDKSARILGELLNYLVETQREDGSWGSEPNSAFATLALLASEDRAHRKAAERSVRWYAGATTAVDSGSLINWRYMAAGIVLSEYYLLTRKAWVLPEIQEVHDFIMGTQYTDLAQVNPRVRETHPDDYPTDAARAHGGWGHNPGFEGYGPIAMITGQGALALALMCECGIKVERAKHDAAYAFLERGTGANGYLWYADSAASESGWADMGRTGASAVANFLSPYQDAKYRRNAVAHAEVIGEHPQSFPDTHGSPIMGMGYAAAAAAHHGNNFRRLMDANRWWFALAQCVDGSYYYQPNRDNAGYGDDSRVSASAVTAFIFSIPKRNLAITGR